MFERDRDLRRGIVRPAREMTGERRRLGGMVGRRGLRARVVLDQVPGEHEPVAVGDRRHLVQAVGVEGREAGLERVVAAEIDARFLVAVAHDQPAAGAAGRQGEHEGRDHAGRLLAVAVRLEEITRPVDQQLVELGPQSAANAEAVAHLVENLVEHAPQAGALDRDAAGVDLERAADGAVVHRLDAPAERGFGRQCCERVDLRRGHGKADLADASDREHGHAERDPGAGGETTVPADRRQQGRDMIEEGMHDAHPRLRASQVIR
jgi:hypothetical protein